MSGLVSILIPAYRHEAYIRDMIESILVQDYPEIEVFIADDRSPDNTLQVALTYKEQLEAKCKYVEIYENETNLGLNNNVNGMLEKCHGEFVKVIASDDFLMPGAITKYVEYFEAHPEVGCAFSNALKVNEEANFSNYSSLNTGEFFTKEPVIESGKALLEHLFRENFFCTPAHMSRKRNYDRVGGYDRDLKIEDWDYYMRVAEAGIGVGYIDEILVGYRMAATSMTHEPSEDNRLMMVGSQLETLIKHKDGVTPEVFMQVFASQCYTALDKVDQRGYKRLKKYVLKQMRAQGVSTLKWHVHNYRSKREK